MRSSDVLQICTAGHVSNWPRFVLLVMSPIGPVPGTKLYIPRVATTCLLHPSFDDMLQI